MIYVAAVRITFEDGSDGWFKIGEGSKSECQAMADAFPGLAVHDGRAVLRADASIIDKAHWVRSGLGEEVAF